MAHEALLWGWLRKGTKGMRSVDLHRVENLLSRGTPDVHYCVSGRSGWIELKGVDRPKRPTTPITVGLRPEQAEWLEGYWACDGTCWIYLRVGEDRAVARYLLRGSSAFQLLNSRASEDSLRLLSVLPPDHTVQDLLMRLLRPRP